MIALTTNASAADSGSGKIVLYFFWGNGCPHCAEMEPYIKTIEDTYPQVEVKRSEIFYNQTNSDLLDTMASAYQKNASVVPTVFVGDQMIEGYGGKTTEDKIENEIKRCSAEKCPTPDEKLKALLALTSTSSTTTTSSKTTTSSTTTTTIAMTTSTSPAITTTSRPQAAGMNITLYFFWGNGCQHCVQMEPFIEGIQKNYSTVKVKSLEVFNNETNARLFDTMAKAYGGEASGVPTTFVGDKMIEGYVPGVSDKNVTDEINVCLQEGCPSPDQILAQYMQDHPTATTIKTTTTIPAQATTTTQVQAGQDGDDNSLIIGAVIVIALIAIAAYLFKSGGKKQGTEKGKEE